MTLSRRRFLQSASAGVLSASILSKSALFGSETPNYEILETKLIARIPGTYFGWGTIGMNPFTNELYVVASGREAHVCPFGRVDFFRSKDLGETWTWPQTILDGPTDDRDSGILVTKKGTLLVTTFTSEGYLGILNEEIARRQRGETPEFDDEKFARWIGVRDRITREAAKKELGCWMIRSTDNGINWSAKYPTPFNSPHGPIECSDGRLLYPGRNFYQKEEIAGVAESTDDGQSWHVLGIIPPRDGDNPGFYHELHGVEAADGTIIVQIRNHNSANDGETLQAESADGGKTWSQPHTIGVWGLPSHILRLNDDRLLMTYGYRRDKMGNRARVSTDNGKTWSNEMIISDDAGISDVGYPSSVQLPDGSIITAWYENMGTTCMRMAKWRLN